ncbi:MAG: PIN domain-containing protein [Saccharofermentanales bacterium]|jgi:predicted nucleic acid-binding protein
MKILIDTNILISAILFSNSKPARALLKVSEEHDMVFCEQNFEELREVVKRKAPEYLPEVEVLLLELSYELIPSSYHEQNSFEIQRINRF